MLTDCLCAWPLRPWIMDGGQTPSRRSTAQLVGALAARLERAGLRPGDRVGWWPRADREALVHLLALWQAGAEVAVLPLRAPLDELVQEACRLGLRATAGTQLPAMPDLEMDMPLATDSRPPRGLPGRVLLRSSGSMGGPRWIQHGVENLVLHARALCLRLQVGPPDVWQLSLPMDHVGGLAPLFRALAGGCALLVSRQADKPAAQASWISLVPTQLARLVEDGQDPARLRGVLMGGAALPSRLARQALDLGWPLWMGYGSTETGSAICVVDLAQWKMEGPPPAGCPHAPHRLWMEEGRICVASPCLSQIVLDERGRPRSPAEPVWRSGDVGFWRKGRLQVQGRLDRVLVSGGEKIPPERVEEALLSLPGLRQAMVVPVRDDHWGERPVAFVQWKEGADLELQSVRRLLVGIPRHWHPVALLPWPAEAEGLKASAQRLRELAEHWWREQGEAPTLDHPERKEEGRG